MTEAKTYTLDVPGAVLHYYVREVEASTDPILLMIGSPMDASGFTSLAQRFQDRTVVTYDPRGAGRSERTDTAIESTPERHADDLHRLISALGGGPVDIFASSGGAVNGLALVARHPEQVRVLVAHEPPAAQVLPDREQALAAVMDMHRTYQRDGFDAAMAKFIAVTSWLGEIPADFADRPAPNPADFGLPADDDGSRDDVMFAQNLTRAPTTSRTSTRCARHRPGSSSVWGSNPRASWPIGLGSPSRSGWARSRSSSPAATRVSSAGSSACRASLRPSR